MSPTQGAGGATLAAAVRGAVKGGTVERARRLVAERYTAEAMGRAWGASLEGAAGGERPGQLRRP